MDGSGDFRSSLESNYHYYRQLFEDRSRLTWQEEGKIRHPILKEYVALLYKEFWKRVDSMTRMYFRMIKLHRKRSIIEKKINKIWKQYVSFPKEVKQSSGSEFSCRYSESTSCAENSERRKSENLVKRWFKTRVVRYKIASEFATELRLAILMAVQHSMSAHSIQFLPPKFSGLDHKKEWFRGQTRVVQNNINQLATSCHLLRTELNSDPTTTEYCMSLTEKKIKPNSKRKEVNKSPL